MTVEMTKLPSVKMPDRLISPGTCECKSHGSSPCNTHKHTHVHVRLCSDAQDDKSAYVWSSGQWSGRSRTHHLDVLAVLEPAVRDVVRVALRLAVELHARPLVPRRIFGRSHDVGVA